MADVLATVWAGSVHLLHGHLEWIADQLFADTAEDFYLEKIAAIYGLTKTPAAFATGNVDGTGTNGTLIPSGTVFVRDDGATYESTANATIAGGVVSIPLQATEAGDDGNLDTGETLEVESPIAGLDSTVTVDSSGIGGGTDEETIEELRARLLLRLREPPAGGSDQDYEQWSLAVAGVTRAWVFRHENGLGTVVVRFVRDNDSGSIFPSAGEVTTVQTALDALRPTTAEVTAAAPVQLDVDFTIELDPDSTALRDEVELSLEDLLLREAEPGDGAGRGTILLSQIRTAIGVAIGDGDYTLTVPAADVVPATGELAVVGSITWV